MPQELRRRISLSEDAQHQNKTLNTIARLHYSPAFMASHRNGVLSAIFLAKRFLVPEYRRKFTMVERADMHSLGSEYAVGAHLRNILTDMPALLKRADDLRPAYERAVTGMPRETEFKGVCPSEMFFVYAAIKPFAPRQILESGRCRPGSE